MSSLIFEPDTVPEEAAQVTVRLRREQSYPSTVLHGTTDGSPAPLQNFTTQEQQQQQRRTRPRSASYVALRSAVYQLTCLSDFNREKIGSGFFADVYKVKHKTTGEVMVLKMNKCRTNSRKMLSEIQLMNRLSHPNILKFRGSCVHEGQLHCLTEYINGGSLSTWLHNTNIELSWTQRVKIARDIARGMAYLHSKGVFHRDLNSSNCLIQKHPAGHLRTVVADFGLAAKIKQRRRRSHTEIVGSPYWMAPECLHGQSYCEQADVFSFGITLAEIVARVSADPEYMPRTKQFGMDCEALREMCPDCPVELFDLMQRCCQLDPDDRPTFEDIVKVLESIQLDEGEVVTTSDEDLVQHQHREENRQVVQSPTSDSIDLRSCISEPFLRLEDSNEDLRTTSEILIHSRLDSTSSLATSTEASSSGSSGSVQRIIEEEECEISLLESHETEAVSLVDSVPAFVREHVKELDQSESLKTAYSEAAQRPISNNLVVEGNGSVSSTSKEEEELSDTKMLARRSSEGDLKSNRLTLSYQEDRDTISKQRLNRKFRNPLIKSISLNTANEQESSQPSGKLGHLHSNILNSSMQTLVGDENEDLKVDNLCGGGDSGIDPGEAEVFQFPPRIESCDNGESGIRNGNQFGARQNGVVLTKVQRVEEESCVQNTAEVAVSAEGGDLTPLCASPTFIGTSKPVVPRVRMGNPLINGTMTTQSFMEGEDDEEEDPLPISRQFPPSGVITPDGSHVHDSFITPHRSSSPNTHSCASSEFSFCLPSPSFPWAPPSSPTPFKKQSRSLPTTPTHGTPPSSLRNHFRYSQEITTHNLCSAVYPMNLLPDDGLSDYDESQVDVSKNLYTSKNFADGEITEKFVSDHVHVRGKMVHFLPVDMDNDLCKRLDEDFSNTALDDSSYKVVHRRSRSHSNPAHVIRRQSGGNNYSLTYARSPPAATAAELYGATPRPCATTHHTTQQFKCYNIRQRRSIRLSNSAPNIPSLLSLCSAVH